MTQNHESLSLSSSPEFKQQTVVPNYLVGSDFLTRMVREFKCDNFNPIKAWLGTIEPNCRIAISLTLSVIR